MILDHSKRGFIIRGNTLEGSPRNSMLRDFKQKQS